MQDAAVLQAATGTDQDEPDSLCDALAQLIFSKLQTPANQLALQTMVQQQIRMDPIGIEGIADAWHRLTGNHLEECAESASSALKNELLAPPTLAEYEQAATNYCPEIHNIGQLRQAIVSHLLSATLKDASFFLQLESPGVLQWVDLDPKPIQKLPGYVITDQSIAHDFAAWAERNPGDV